MEQPKRFGSALHVRLPTEIVECVRAVAAADDRPVSWLVRHWIEAGLRETRPAAGCVSTEPAVR
jgi:predicted DNA-binding protein